MWKPWRWAGASNERAISNARAGATECSRRCIERADVALYLAARFQESEERTTSLSG